MTVNVLGKKSGSFTDQKTGEVIGYARLYVTAPFEANTFADAPVVEGIQCLEIKIPLDMIDKVKVGGKAKIYYNQKGRVEEVISIQ